LQVLLRFECASVDLAFGFEKFRADSGQSAPKTSARAARFSKAWFKDLQKLTGILRFSRGGGSAGFATYLDHLIGMRYVCAIRP